MKVKGINLNTKTLDLLTFETMLNMSKDFASGSTTSLELPQLQICTDKHHNVYTKYYNKIYRPTSDKRCVHLINTTHYGYRGRIPGTNMSA